jgi:hypothetical protein
LSGGSFSVNTGFDEARTSGVKPGVFAGGTSAYEKSRLAVLGGAILALVNWAGRVWIERWFAGMLLAINDWRGMGQASGLDDR